MLAGEKSKGSNNYENFLFPLTDMYISQGEETESSHADSLAMDFLGWNLGFRIYECPYYAPFSCKLVAIYGSTSPFIVWESNTPVNFIDGTLDYATIAFVHDNNTTQFRVGETRSQGEVIGHTGTYGFATGDHVHIEVAKGKYAGFYQNSHGTWCIRNAYHLYNAFGVNDTVLVRPLNYEWREFSITPYVSSARRFPWVLYSKKFREKRR